MLTRTTSIYITLVDQWLLCSYAIWYLLLLMAVTSCKITLKIFSNCNGVALWFVLYSQPAGWERANIGDDCWGRLHPQVYSGHVAQPNVVRGDHKETTQPHSDLWPRLPWYCPQEDVLPAGIHRGAARLSAQATSQSRNTNSGEQKRHDL